MFYIDTTNLDCIEEYELYRYINRFTEEVEQRTEEVEQRTEEVEQRTEEDLLEDVLIGGC